MSDEVLNERQFRKPRNIAVIPCAGAKQDCAAPAGELYTSSNFKGQMAAAQSSNMEADETLILSAKHGLVHPDTVLEPYDMKMGDKGSVEPEHLANQAVHEFGIQPEDNVYAMLPDGRQSPYFRTLSAGLQQAGIAPQHVFESAPSIGYQRSAVKRIRETEIPETGASAPLTADEEAAWSARAAQLRNQ